jgi:hypothetical protein
MVREKTVGFAVAQTSKRTGKDQGDKGINAKVAESFLVTPKGFHVG